MHSDLIVIRAVGKTLQMKQKHHRHTVTFVSGNICSASLGTHSDGTEGCGWVLEKGRCPYNLSQQADSDTPEVGGESL